MSGIRQAGTDIELALGRLLRSLGAYHSTSNRDLPGSPDLANRRRRWAIFVHGCFWHGHPRCKLATLPKRNRAFWLAKIADNRARDLRKARALRSLGYRVITVWGCELQALPAVPAPLLARLRPILPAGTTTERSSRRRVARRRRVPVQR